MTELNLEFLRRKLTDVEEKLKATEADVVMLISIALSGAYQDGTYTEAELKDLIIRFAQKYQSKANQS